MTRRILLPSLALGASILFSQAQDAKIDTVAGNGEIGFFGDGGRALEAALHQPFGVVVSPAGDIVFCDTNNHVIRRISRKKRTIETIVGTGEKGWSGDGGPPSEAKFDFILPEICIGSRECRTPFASSMHERISFRQSRARAKPVFPVTADRERLPQ
jgi:hypothetical protein